MASDFASALWRLDPAATDAPRRARANLPAQSTRVLPCQLLWEQRHFTANAGSAQIEVPFTGRLTRSHGPQIAAMINHASRRQETLIDTIVLVRATATRKHVLLIATSPHTPEELEHCLGTLLGTAIRQLPN